MTETSRNIVLADRTFSVPLLPLRHNRVVYPLCRDLSAAEGDDSFFARLAQFQGTPDAVRDEEWDKLITIAFLAASAADKAMTREVFDEMAITPPQLVDAFFNIRIQTGAWVAPDAVPAAEATGVGEDTTGEAAGA